jgi:hypothetical protein
MSPKIRVKPAATTKNRPASVMPLSVTCRNVVPPWVALIASHTTTMRPSALSTTRGDCRATTLTLGSSLYGT